MVAGRVKYKPEVLEKELQKYKSVREAAIALNINYSYLCELIRRYGLKAPLRASRSPQEKYDAVLNMLKEEPLFSHEIPLRNSQIKGMRVYAYWMKNINVKKFSVRRKGCTFVVYFLEGDEMRVLKKVKERYPELFSLPPQILMAELRKLFGNALKNIKGEWYYINGDRRYRLNLKEKREPEPEEDAVISEGIVSIDNGALQARSRDSLYRRKAMKIMEALSNTPSNQYAYSIMLKNEKEAFNYAYGLKRYLPSQDYEVHRRKNMIFVFKKVEAGREFS